MVVFTLPTFAGSVSTDNKLLTGQNSATKEPVSAINTKNPVKIVKTTVKVVKMPIKDYKEMVSTLNQYKKVKKTNQPSYNWKSKNLVISDKSYLDAIKRYNSWTKKYGKAPFYVNIFNSTKITYESNSNTSTTNNSKSNVKKSASLSLAGELVGYDGLNKLQKYMNANLNHRDGGPSTFAGVFKAKVGDCWGLAEWAAKQLKSNNYKVRIVQGASSAASNHRWVQVNINGKWINFESSLVTKKYGSKSYSKTCARVNKVVTTL